MTHKSRSKPERHRAGLKLAGIMFLDIQGFSKLTQTQLERFLDSVLPALSQQINPYRSALMDLNTWGDAIIAVSENPVQLARLALDLRDYFAKTNFEALGLPQTLRSRISLHAGTVKYGFDPIRRRNGVIGSNITLAARMEPIIVPGEVWATHEFEHMLSPHTAAERLAFDDLGPRDLAKGYGLRPLRRLHRAHEETSLSRVAQDALLSTRSRSTFSRAFDVVGVGALNTDYIVTVTSLRKHKPDLIAENEELFEIGRERPAAREEVEDVIAEIGRSLLTVSLGGSSFNTMHALACAMPEFRLAYVGVAGVSEAESGFMEALRSLKIDTTLVRLSGTTSGKCVSYISQGERSLLTWPGANEEMGTYLRERRDDVLEMLGRSRLVHITSLFDAVSPEILAGILREAKNQNPWLQISFDPGHDWVLRSKSGEADFVREIMGLSSYLFVNQREFEILSSDLGIKDDQDLARDIFKHLSSQAVLILLKKYNEIRVFHRLHRRVKEVRYLSEPLKPAQVEDATGAGDVFAAGLFIAMMVPGLELRDGIEIGLRMVRRKLQTPGATGYSTFDKTVEDYVDSLYDHEVDEA